MCLYWKSIESLCVRLKIRDYFLSLLSLKENQWIQIHSPIILCLHLFELSIWSWSDFDCRKLVTDEGNEGLVAVFSSDSASWGDAVKESRAAEDWLIPFSILFCFSGSPGSFPVSVQGEAALSALHTADSEESGLLLWTQSDQDPQKQGTVHQLHSSWLIVFSAFLHFSPSVHLIYSFISSQKCKVYFQSFSHYFDTIFMAFPRSLLTCDNRNLGWIIRIFSCLNNIVSLTVFFSQVQGLSNVFTVKFSINWKSVCLCFKPFVLLVSVWLQRKNQTLNQLC